MGGLFETVPKGLLLISLLILVAMVTFAASVLD